MMMVLNKTIGLVFNVALFINALLFIPQSIRILKEKTVKGLSFITFFGLLLIHILILFKGLISEDILLISGAISGILTIGCVLMLIMVYRGKIPSKANKIELDEILAQLPAHIYWKDENCVFVGSNTNNWRDFGLKSLADFIGKTDYDLFSKEEADPVREIDQKVMKEGKIVIAEEWLTKDDGSKVLYLSCKKPLENKKGEIVGVLGCSIDITSAKQKTLDELAVLDNVIAVMPGNVYWMDKDGVYLGCNDNEAKAVGLISRKDIIGKRNIDIPGFVIPEIIDAVNKQVLLTGKTITIEEPVVFNEGAKGVVLSTKTPIYDSRGHVAGLVGISIDITDKKEAEALRSKQALMEVAAQVSHDIRSPLAALNTVLRNLPTIPEDQRVLIRNAVTRINDIANNLLVEYRGDGAQAKSGDKQQLGSGAEKTELLSSLLDSLLSEKKAQISNRRVELHLEIAPEAFALFVRLETTSFKRMISNLLNNAIEAIAGKGSVTVCLQPRDEFACIRLKDSGKGMSAAVLEKVKGGGTSHGKSQGTGIGIASAISLVEQAGGRFDMTSQEGAGTTVTVELPTVSAPSWFQEALTLTPGSTVVVLDDDESIHSIWASRCQPFCKDIQLKHIHHSKSFREYCAVAEVANSLFLVDYELLGSDETGLDLIEALNLSERAILVTSRYEESKVRERVKKLGVKIIPKNFSPYIAISMATAEAEMPAPDLVFIDDDKTLTRAWEQAAKQAGLRIKTFNRTADFRKILPSLPKTTAIYIDSNLGEAVDGEIFAKELYEQGMLELYLASGHPQEYFGELPWIKDFVGKEPPF